MFRAISLLSTVSFATSQCGLVTIAEHINMVSNYALASIVQTRVHRRLYYGSTCSVHKGITDSHRQVRMKALPNHRREQGNPLTKVGIIQQCGIEWKQYHLWSIPLSLAWIVSSLTCIMLKSMERNMKTRENLLEWLFFFTILYLFMHKFYIPLKYSRLTSFTGYRKTHFHWFSREVN